MENNFTQAKHEVIDIIDSEIDRIQTAVSNQVPLPNSLETLQAIRQKVLELNVHDNIISPSNELSGEQANASTGQDNRGDIAE